MTASPAQAEVTVLVAILLILTEQHSDHALTLKAGIL